MKEADQNGRINIPRKVIAEFCERNHIQRLSIFGSVLRDDFRQDSDIDILVEFEPGYPVGYIRLAGIELELSEIFGHEVDLRTPADLSPYFQQEVLNLAEVQYVKEG